MTNAEARFNKIHIRKVYACLAVTCHLHFWQNDRDFLRATVVTRGWNGYRNKSQHRKSTLQKKILPPFQQGFEPATFWGTPLGSLLTYLCDVFPALINSFVCVTSFHLYLTPLCVEFCGVVQSSLIVSRFPARLLSRMYRSDKPTTHSARC